MLRLPQEVKGMLRLIQFNITAAGASPRPHSSAPQSVSLGLHTSNMSLESQLILKFGLIFSNLLVYKSFEFMYCC
jgi:hypothetical protein